ncbi:ABC transporter ATP-binding protein [Streptomyces nigrescens]|uniref:ATP-binding cassette domain-containing protein n=3 Tax=Streptomyces nigrescens TaxID=1920 RepID=A0ABY7IVG1_STRNI|nr:MULTISPECIES: ATP-binding cassette domain-containing protein [Streptomyces]WAU01939.1 ATP-binding cassette domain-containing protein [Streptomyces libani subsp. libani]WAU09825.1 ATP-binding cassette domain-containing protein [Streptomyces nigrescens]
MKVSGLSCTFRGKRVVDDVSLTLRAGSVTGFVGSNGAGKTTTLRLMLGLLRGEGATTFLGRPLTQWSAPARVVGAVFGGVGGHPKHRIRDHLRMVAAGAGASNARVDELLETVGMTGAAKMRISQLSLGMAQRVGITQAVIGSPRVLVLDEPSNGLDPHAIRWLRGFLRDLAADGVAVLVSSHLLVEMEQLADRVVVLSRGRVVAETPMEALLSYAVSKRTVTVQTSELVELAGLVKRAGGLLEVTGGQKAEISGLSRVQVADMAAVNGIALYRLDEQSPSLEDFYVTIAQEDFKI